MVFSPQRLCAKFQDSVRAMAEIRILCEFGDYTAIACAEFKDISEVDDEGKKRIPKWRKDATLDWQQINDTIQMEKRSLKENKGRFKQPETPWINETQNTARALGITEAQVQFEIEHYARRNGFCHNGIKSIR